MIGEIKMNYKNRKIIEIAQQLGYTTVKEFANFLRIYKPSISTNESGKKFISLSLI
jgi:hypothetical protein